VAAAPRAAGARGGPFPSCRIQFFFPRNGLPRIEAMIAMKCLSVSRLRNPHPAPRVLIEKFLTALATCTVNELYGRKMGPR